MNKHIQIRDVPEAMHRAVKARAAAEGLSLSDYLRRLIGKELEKPSWDEMIRRMKALPTIKLSESTADMIRRERDSR